MSLTYNELQKIIGRYLGYKRDVYGPDNGSDEWADIEECIKSGLAQFYSPPPLHGSDTHQWSFMRPIATLDLVVGQEDYDLPADFGGLIGQMTYPSGNDFAVIHVGENQIRKARQKTARTGNPSCVAIRAKGTDGSAAQGYQAIFYPKPDADVTLTYKYYVIPQDLSDTEPYPYGGKLHRETIIESCLAIAESRLNDIQDVHAKKFIERLAASIKLDQKVGGRDYFGYNGDGSSRRLTQYRDETMYYVTVNGQDVDE